MVPVNIYNCISHLLFILNRDKFESVIIWKSGKTICRKPLIQFSFKVQKCFHCIIPSSTYNNMNVVGHKREVINDKGIFNTYQSYKHHSIRELRNTIKYDSALPPVRDKVVISFPHIAVFFPLFSVFYHITNMKIVIGFKRCETDKNKKRHPGIVWWAFSVEDAVSLCCFLPFLCIFTKFAICL